MHVVARASSLHVHAEGDEPPALGTRDVKGPGIVKSFRIVGISAVVVAVADDHFPAYCHGTVGVPTPQEQRKHVCPDKRAVRKTAEVDAHP